MAEEKQPDPLDRYFTPLINFLDKDPLPPEDEWPVEAINAMFQYTGLEPVTMSMGGNTGFGRVIDTVVGENEDETGWKPYFDRIEQVLRKSSVSMVTMGVLSTVTSLTAYANSFEQYEGASALNIFERKRLKQRRFARYAIGRLAPLYRELEGLPAWPSAESPSCDPDARGRAIKAFLDDGVRVDRPVWPYDALYNMFHVSAESQTRHGLPCAPIMFAIELIFEDTMGAESSWRDDETEEDAYWKDVLAKDVVNPGEFREIPLDENEARWASYLTRLRLAIREARVPTHTRDFLTLRWMLATVRTTGEFGKFIKFVIWGWSSLTWEGGDYSDSPQRWKPRSVVEFDITPEAQTAAILEILRKNSGKRASAKEKKAAKPSEDDLVVFRTLFRPYPKSPKPPDFVPDMPPTILSNLLFVALPEKTATDPNFKSVGKIFQKFGDFARKFDIVPAYEVFFRTYQAAIAAQQKSSRPSPGSPVPYEFSSWGAVKEYFAEAVEFLRDAIRVNIDYLAKKEKWSDEDALEGSEPPSEQEAPYVMEDDPAPALAASSSGLSALAVANAVQVEVLSQGQPHLKRLRIQIGSAAPFETTQAVVASLYQKAVRRGDVFWTAVAAAVYYKSGVAFAAFKNLRTFALEDKAGSTATLLARIRMHEEKFMKAYGQAVGVAKSKLKSGEAGARFPAGVQYALDAALEVCRTPSSRIAAMLAFTGLSEAVAKYLSEEKRPAIIADNAETLTNERLLAIRETAWAWKAFQLGVDAKGPRKNDMLWILEQLYARKYPGQKLKEDYRGFAVHRLGFAALAADLYLNLQDGTQEAGDRPVVQPEVTNALPRWALDKHTAEGKRLLAEAVKQTGGDVHTQGLVEMFTISFDLQGHEINHTENAFWNAIGRETYMWWDTYDLKLRGRTRKFSLGKTKHLLVYWSKLAERGPVKTTKPAKAQAPPRRGRTSVAAIVGRGKGKARPRSTTPAPRERKKKARKPAAKGPSQAVLDSLHCIAQLPTRTGKLMITYFARNEQGEKVWRKGPYPPEMIKEVWAEIDADLVFKQLDGVEPRNLREIRIDGEIYMEAPALFWPTRCEERPSKVLGLDSIRVAVVPPEAPVRSLSTKDYARLAREGKFGLLQKIFDAHVLKRELGCNDLVHRNVIVDFANERVYPIDCTVLEGPRKPDLIHGSSAEVRSVLRSDQVKVQGGVYRAWATQLAGVYPTAAANLEAFAARNAKDELFPSAKK